MVSKINKFGFTIVELLLVMSVLAGLILLILVIINPVVWQQRARDNVRMKDALLLSRAIEEYVLDNKVPPDADDTFRRSDLLPIGHSGPVENAATGWLNLDFSAYIQKLPVDPLNVFPYVYGYQRSGTAYELNVKLESDTETMENDGGDNSAVYEIGTSLTILN